MLVKTLTLAAFAGMLLMSTTAQAQTQCPRMQEMMKKLQENGRLPGAGTKGVTTVNVGKTGAHPLAQPSLSNMAGDLAEGERPKGPCAAKNVVTAAQAKAIKEMLASTNSAGGNYPRMAPTPAPFNSAAAGNTSLNNPIVPASALAPAAALSAGAVVPSSAATPAAPKVPADVARNMTPEDIAKREKEMAAQQQMKAKDDRAATSANMNVAPTASADPNLPPALDRLSKKLIHALRADKDGDSAISPAEFLAPLEKGFDRLDKNKDGKIAADEVGERHAKLIGKYDKDGDKAVSLEEFVALAKERFAEADGDGDKKVTVAELLALTPKHA